MVMSVIKVVWEWVDTLILATIFAMMFLIASVAMMRLVESLRTARRRLSGNQPAESPAARRTSSRTGNTLAASGPEHRQAAFSKNGPEPDEVGGQRLGRPRHRVARA